MFNHMSNRKVDVQITPYLGIYVTIIVRVKDCNETEKELIMEEAKEFYKIAMKYNGETYKLPVYTPIDFGEVVFYNTYLILLKREQNSS